MNTKRKTDNSIQILFGEFLYTQVIEDHSNDISSETFGSWLKEKEFERASAIRRINQEYRNVVSIDKGGIHLKPDINITSLLEEINFHREQAQLSRLIQESSALRGKEQLS